MTTVKKPSSSLSLLLFFKVEHGASWLFSSKDVVTFFPLTTLKGTALILTLVIVDFSTLIGTNVPMTVWYQCTDDYLLLLNIRNGTNKYLVSFHTTLNAVH